MLVQTLVPFPFHPFFFSLSSDSPRLGARFCVMPDGGGEDPPYSIRLFGNVCQAGLGAREDAARQEGDAMNSISRYCPSSLHVVIRYEDQIIQRAFLRSYPITNSIGFLTILFLYFF